MLRLQANGRVLEPFDRGLHRQLNPLRRIKIPVDQGLRIQNALEGSVERLIRRFRRTPEHIERRRRQALRQAFDIVDGAAHAVDGLVLIQRHQTHRAVDQHHPAASCNHVGRRAVLHVRHAVRNPQLFGEALDKLAVVDQPVVKRMVLDQQSHLMVRMERKGREHVGNGFLHAHIGRIKLHLTVRDELQRIEEVRIVRCVEDFERLERTFASLLPCQIARQNPQQFEKDVRRPVRSVMMEFRPEAHVPHMVENRLVHLVANVVFHRDGLRIGKPNRHLANVLRVDGQRRASVDPVFLERRKTRAKIPLFKEPDADPADIRQSHGLPMKRTPVAVKTNVRHAFFTVIASNPLGPLVERARIVERLATQSPKHSVAAAEIDLVNPRPLLLQTFRQLTEEVALRALQQ